MASKKTIRKVRASVKSSIPIETIKKAVKKVAKKEVKIQEPERLYVESLTSSKKFVMINFSDGSNRTFALVHRGNSAAIEEM